MAGVTSRSLATFDTYSLTSTKIVIAHDIVDREYLVPLPERDSEGRKVIFSCAAKFDPYKYTSAQMARVHSIVVESLMDDEENQITGYSHVNDESGLTMGHISLWSLNDIRHMLRCIQNSTPMRHKSTHFINVPTYANKVFDFFTALLNEKLKNRVMGDSKLNGNLSGAYSIAKNK
ncbi:hypothetical protein J6590_056224 [Homalodisca vitripennis]|nr:hypothetical protein J6590_056224 [Homalodisca vitripennis]